MSLAGLPDRNKPLDFLDLETRLTRHTEERYVGDLDVMTRRGVLRVITRNNAAHYFIARGSERGFEYELARAFAKSLGLRLAMVVPPSRSALVSVLRSGAGDMIAAGMTVTRDRKQRVLFTEPVREVPRVMVTHPYTVKLLESLTDLSAFKIHVSFRSTTYRDAKALERRLGVSLRLVDVSDDPEMEEMMRRISVGRYEASIIDQDLVDLEKAAGAEVAARVAVTGPLPKAWGFRHASKKLRFKADAFLRKKKKAGLVRILTQKYYSPSSRSSKRAREWEFRADQAGKISPWDHLFRREGKRTGLDWRLLAAVSYAESRFDAKAKSRFGAVGLMQVLPSTAKELGVTKLENPSNNVRAGAEYLRWLLRRFAEPSLKPRQRVRFALASYNAGVGHVRDARKLAKEIGRDPNRWFGQVERALLLKKQPKWHEKTRYGYCRAGETIAYVSRVQAQYDAYVRHVPLH